MESKREEGGNGRKRGIDGVDTITRCFCDREGREGELEVVESVSGRCVYVYVCVRE